MNTRAVLLIFFLLFSHNALASSRSDAREMIATGTRLPEAINILSSLISKPDAGIAAEYALALASSGLVSAALFEMDRAFILDSTDDEVLFAGSVLLRSLGLVQAADELKRPNPSWVKGDLALLSSPHPRLDAKAPLGACGKEMKKAAELLEKSRFISALDRFARITAVYPKESLGWAGYAVALEKVGAYKTSAKAVGKEIALSPHMDADTQAHLVAHQKDLLELPPLEKKKLNQSLQGRYTAFIGGSLSGGNGTSTTRSLSAQLGKFFTNNLNLSLDFSDSSASNAAIGLGGRLYIPLPVDAPLSLTLGSRLEYDTVAPVGAGHFGWVVSPGLSEFVGTGSLDLFYDYGVSGSQKGTKTLSLGYTFYFGGTP